MGVYIKDVGMPRGCNECFFAPRCWMRPLDTTFFASIKPDGCPMVEVKVPHGRLVDGDAIVNQFDEESNEFMKERKTTWALAATSAANEVNRAQTIILAERK